MNSIQGLNGNLYKLFTRLHYFGNAITTVINYCAPFTRDSKTFYDINFILILESTVGNLHSLTNVCTLRMLGKDHCPRIFLEDK